MPRSNQDLGGVLVEASKVLSLPSFGHISNNYGANPVAMTGPISDLKGNEPDSEPDATTSKLTTGWYRVRRKSRHPKKLGNSSGGSTSNRAIVGPQGSAPQEDPQTSIQVSNTFQLLDQITEETESRAVDKGTDIEIQDLGQSCNEAEGRSPQTSNPGEISLVLEVGNSLEHAKNSKSLAT